LDKIVALRAPWPIATSGSSASRFEVAEDNYQRHVELLDGDDDVLAEFFLGTSPGYQRVHARVADSSDIFSVELSNFELSANLDSWMDKSLLASPEAPSRIHVVMPGSKDQANADRPEPGASDPDTIVTEPRFMPLDAVLERNDEGWAINGNPADQDAAQSYANRFDTLRVLGAADDADAVEHVATVDLTDSEGDLQLTFARKDDDANDYVVKSSRVDGAYRVAAYIAEQIMMTDSDFLPRPEIEEEESQSVSSETQSTP
jgi:hypothetical protein